MEKLNPQDILNNCFRVTGDESAISLGLQHFVQYFKRIEDKGDLRRMECKAQSKYGQTDDNSSSDHAT
ncbi:hypothetical protein ACTXT7_001554 [Hymenolepis weldensis]